MAPRGAAGRLAVRYQWVVRAGCEEEFMAIWSRMTRIIREQHGSLGSRLHRADDGSFVAYAQWPDRQTWDAWERYTPNQVEADMFTAMKACIEQFFPHQVMVIIEDQLVTMPPE